MLSIIILSELLKPTDFFKHVFNIFMTKYGGRLKNLKHMVSLLYYLDTLQDNYTNMNLVLHCREKKKWTPRIGMFKECWNNFRKIEFVLRFSFMYILFTFLLSHFHSQIHCLVYVK